MKHPDLKNILLVSNYPSDTAYAWWLMEHFWISIAEHFGSKGHKVYLAYPTITTIPQTIEDTDIKVVQLNISSMSLRESLEVLSFIRKNNISYLYLTDMPYFNPEYFLYRIGGLKKIMVHDHTPGDRPPQTGIKGLIKLARNVAPWITADIVLCVSEHMRQRNITNARIPKHKCLVVQNGIPPINCGRESLQDARQGLGIDQSTLVVVTTGRAHPYKRFDFIIDVAHIISTRSPELDIIFLLIGDGPALPSLENKVDELQLQDFVKLLGYRADVKSILCASDIAIHAALGEGFSLSIIEYMSAGLPVLVPDIPSVSQAITDRITGLIYDRNTPDSAAALITDLACDTEFRKEMGIAAKTVADTDYSLENCTREFLSAVQTCIV